MRKADKGSVITRPGKTRDLAASDRIDSVCFPDLVASGHSEPVAGSPMFEWALVNRQMTRRVFQVAEVNKRVIGYAFGAPVDENTNSLFLNLDLIAVLPEAQGKGIGSAVIQASIIEARRAGYHFVVAKTKVSTIPFFESNGFSAASAGSSLEWLDPIRNSMLMPGESASERKVLVRFSPDKVTGHERLVFRPLREETYASPHEIFCKADTKAVTP